MKYLFILISFYCFGQTYPTPINLDDVEVENYTPPTELPQYLQPYTNRYGNTVTRVSDVAVFGVNSQQLGHNYSKDQVWNSDESLMKLAGKPSAILDGNTYEFLYWANNVPGYSRWSNVEPNIMYGISQNYLLRYDVTTDQRTIIHEFDYLVDFGYGEGFIGGNDKYIGLLGGGFYIVYDLENNTYVTKPRINGDLDWFTVSPSGRFAVAQFRPDGNAVNEGMKLFDIDLSNERHISDYSGHGAFVDLDNGQEVFVQFGNEPQWNQNYSLEMINLDTEQSTNVFYWHPNHGNSGIWGGHISASDRPNMVYISEGCCYNHGTLPSENFALNVLTNEIERFGKNHSRAHDNNGNSRYTHEARGSVNRDGTKMIYVSNYFQPEVESLNSGLAFVVEVPQPTLSTEDFTKNEIPIEVIYKSIDGKILTTLENAANGIYIIEKRYQNRVEQIKFIKW